MADSVSDTTSTSGELELLVQEEDSTLDDDEFMCEPCGRDEPGASGPRAGFCTVCHIRPLAPKQKNV